MIDALKKVNRRLALELYILHKTCRRDGWDGLRPGQVRLSISEAADLLGCNRGNASHLLGSIMSEWGLQKVDGSVLSWPDPTAALTAAPTATLEALSLNGFSSATAAPTAAPTATASIYNNQESKKHNAREARLSPEDESTIDEGLRILREIYPKVYHDGSTAPAYSKSLTRERVRSLASPTRPVGELFLAVERYLEESKTAKRYWKAPQNFFGARGPWRDYLEAPCN